MAFDPFVGVRYPVSIGGFKHSNDGSSVVLPSLIWYTVRSMLGSLIGFLKRIRHSGNGSMLTSNVWRGSQGNTEVSFTITE